MHSVYEGAVRVNTSHSLVPLRCPSGAPQVQATYVLVQL